MIETLAPFLTPHIRDLRVVLAAGDAAKGVMRGLDPVIADCNLGPYERTSWLSISAQNLPKDGPVRITKEGERRNWLEVDGEGNTVQFAPYFGSRDTYGRYRIWRKGRETYDLSGMQSDLFTWTDEAKSVPEIVYPYALRTMRRVEGLTVFELHLLLGLLPKKGRPLSSRVIHFGDPFVVTMDDGPTELVPTFDSPFDPQGIA